MSVSSKGEPTPLELTDTCGTVLLFRRPDGRLVFRRQPCKVKACTACGPRMRVRWASEWATAMAPVAGETVYRLVVADGEVAKLRRRKTLAGRELAHLPAPDGLRVVYTTAPRPGAEPVADLQESLSSDFAAMPNDGRRRSRLTDGWAAVLADVEAAAEAAREQWECIGRAGRTLEQVELVARELGLLVGAGPDLLVLDPPDPQTEGRLFARVRLQRGWPRRAEAA